MVVVARRTSMTTATPPASAPGGARPGSKWTRTGRSSAIVGAPLRCRGILRPGGRKSPGLRGNGVHRDDDRLDLSHGADADIAAGQLLGDGADDPQRRGA